MWNCSLNTCLSQQLGPETHFFESLELVRPFKLIGADTRFSYWPEWHFLEAHDRFLIFTGHKFLSLKTEKYGFP